MVQAYGNNLHLGRVVGTNTPVVLPASARKQHVYVCGGTGVGKSKLLEHMIRRDILEWSRTKCGLILLDPHGSIFDNLIAWLADPRNKMDRPIIPIDLRSNRWAVSYNLLHQRPTVNTSVIVDNFVEAMAHVWGESGTTNTPLFARNARMVLRTLYEGHFTLSDVVHLMDSSGKQVRQAMSAKVTDPVAKRHWREVDQLSSRDFIDRMSSTLNRLERFVGHELFRAILGQPDESLDLYQAMEDGAIILVSLATEEGKISEENAHTFGTLLLSDLWTAAKMRRKANNPKPFYVYLDEFQEFITPTIAKSLDQARGFGLHLTMSHQFPLQLKNSGEHGQRLYDSVMENASSKIIFRLQNIENLTPLAHSLFMGVLDPDEVKHRLYSTKVMGYADEIQEDRSRSTTRGQGGASHSSSTRSEGEGGSERMNPDEEEMGSLSAWNQCFSDASGSSESWMNSETESVSQRHVLRPTMGRELSSVQFRSIDEQLFRAMQGLFRQQDRHYAVRMVGQQAPLFARTPDVRPCCPTPTEVKRYFDRQCKRWPFFLPLLEAQHRIDARLTELPKHLLEGASEEAPTARRMLKES